MSQETFERELARRAETVHGAPLSFQDVRGKARSIQRRRRGAVAGAVVAAVALVAIVPTILAGGDAPGSDAPQPAPPVPTPGHTAVLHDGMLTLPDGDTVSLDVDNADVTNYGVLSDGRIVVALMDPYAVRVYQPDGRLEREYAVQSNLVTMSADDSMVAWIGGASTGDRGVRLLLSGVAEPDVFPGIPAAGEYSGSVDAILDPTRLLVNGDQFTDAVLRPGGVEDLETSEPLRVTDVSPDGSLWAVNLEPSGPNQQFGCAALYDPEADEIVAENCDTSFLEFSPDGQHLVGSRGDNMMIGDATVLDLDLKVVGQWEPETDGEVLKSVAWEDATHLLVSEANWQDGTAALARVDLAWSDREELERTDDAGDPEQMNEYLLSE